LTAIAVDQKVQRTSAAPIWQTYFQLLSTAAKGAEIGHHLIQTNELKQALHKAYDLPQKQSKQRFQSETSLDSSVTEVLLPTTPATQWRHPNLRRIKPNRQ